MSVNRVTGPPDCAVMCDSINAHTHTHAYLCVCVWICVLCNQNTTKWVKKALRAKGGAGRDDRKAISEQLQLGQELRAKVR